MHYHTMLKNLIDKLGKAKYITTSNLDTDKYQNRMMFTTPKGL